MRELPKGWVETKIADVTEYVQRGKGPKYTDTKSFPVINQKAIRWFGIQEEHLKYVREDMWDKYTKERFIRSGDILWNSTGTGTIGRACLLNDKEAAKAKVVDSHVTIVRSNKSIDPRYLFNWIKSPRIQLDIESLSTGTTNQVELSKSKVLETNIPLAPLNEQIRIANKLDSMLAKVDAAQARLDKIPNILKRFRQSVLAAATSGELTKDWRALSKFDLSADEILKQIELTRFQKLTDEVRNGNLESRRVLTKVKKHNFTPPIEELPSGWRWSSLMNSMERVVDCHNKTAPYTSDGIFLIRTSDIRDGEIKLTKTRFINQETYEYWSKRCPPKPKDIILTREAPMGEAGVVPADTKLCMGQRMMLLRPIHEYISEKYVLYSLMSESSQKRMQLGAVGTGVKHLRVGDVESFAIKICPYEEQKEIVRRVESLFAMADTVEKQYNDVKARTNRLTQSILAKAFRGELVSQDPNDEPASELLARIKTEQVNLKPSKERKKANSQKTDHV